MKEAGIMSTAVVVLAEGFEEIEAITQIDVLRRAGVQVAVVGLQPGVVEGAHGIGVMAETSIDDFTGEPDLVVLPGGLPGSTNLGESEAVVDLLRRQNEAGRSIGAICAAPAFAPVKAGVLDGKRATCYPSFEAHFNASTTAVEDRVAVDGNLITSRGPGTALEFAYALVEHLEGKATADGLRSAMLVE
jgi:4-methyl-5(b-hydroxyethyl)-thiazole monophosphate biosynthesis